MADKQKTESPPSRITHVPVDRLVCRRALTNTLVPALSAVRSLMGVQTLPMMQHNITEFIYV